MFGSISMAHAYLDPGTGSFILQMVIAGVLGALLYIKLAWASVKAFFSRLFRRGSKPAIDNDQSAEKVEGTDNSS